MNEDALIGAILASASAAPLEETQRPHVAVLAGRNPDEFRCRVCGCLVWHCSGIPAYSAGLALVRASRALLYRLPPGPDRDALVAALAPFESTFPRSLGLAEHG